MKIRLMCYLLSIFLLTQCSSLPMDSRGKAQDLLSDEKEKIHDSAPAGSEILGTDKEKSDQEKADSLPAKLVLDALFRVGAEKGPVDEKVPETHSDTNEGSSSGLKEGQELPAKVVLDMLFGIRK